jgi:hypothetical protein
MVLLPMLAARREPALIERYDAWWPGAQRHFPPNPSPYGAFLVEAVRVWRARAIGEALPDPAPSLAETPAHFPNPHFQAAIDAVTEAWILAGRLDLARAVTAWPLDDDPTPLMRASSALRQAMVARGEGDAPAAAAHARAAAETARRIGADWWLARALRMLDDPGARALERRLGIPA